MLKDKVAIITGAVRGIGIGIARKFAKNGSHIVLNVHPDQSEEGVEKAKDIEGLGVTCMSVGADISDSKQVADLVRKTIDAFGKADILVNNAAVAPHPKSVIDIPEEEWDLVLQVNLASGFRLIRSGLRGMMKRRWGRIVSITSVVGTTGNPGQANYAASKAGLTGLSKSLAQEVASRGITVNCVAPGFIETAMTAALNEDQQQRILAAIPTGRMGRPDEVASSVVFLASEEGAYVTGQTLHVNGGMAMI